MHISADILRGYTDLIILRRLAEGDSYGYQINKQVTGISDGYLAFKEATLYTAFRRMETAGLIQSYWGNEESGARRRYYRLTEAGKEYLERESDTWREVREMLDRLILDDHESKGDIPVIQVS
jgi:DNA-binding PadR family transcriptional regulator